MIMKYFKSTLNFISLAIVLSFLLSACGNDGKKGNPKPQPEYFDTLTVLCENNMKEMMQPAFDGFHETYPAIIVDVEYGTSLDCMKARLGNTKNAVVVSRDFTPEEQNLVKEYKVPYVENPIAQDGLVFFTSRDFPIDTLNAKQIKQWLIDPNYKLSAQFKNLPFEPQLVTGRSESAIYTNLSLLCCDTLPVKRPVKPLASIEDIKNYVRENKTAIGTAYLSDLEGDTTLIAIRIGYLHKDGNAEAPQIVHRSWIIQSRYPYEVRYDIITRPNLSGRNKTMRFLNYVVLNREIQKGFFDRGMIPEHAKFELIKED
jgi:hypothetical protein